jgi:phosphoglycolate phosphatase
MNLIFDFDGTILDTNQAIVSIANQYFSKNQTLPTSLDEVRKTGVKGIIASRDFSSEKTLEFVKWARKELENWMGKLKPFPGMTDVISQLASKHTVGILTNNSVQNVQSIIKECFPKNPFLFVYSENDLFGKEKGLGRIIQSYRFKPEDTYYIGDQVADVISAKKIGIKSIAVSWGYESKNLPSMVSPNLIIDKPSDLLKI